MIDEITTHSDDARDLQLSRYESSETVDELTRALVDEVQRFEAVAFDVYATTLDTATGDALEQYADLVGAKRQGLSDDELRALIRARVAVFHAEGIAWRITNAIAAFLDTDVLYLPFGQVSAFALLFELPDECDPLSDAMRENAVALLRLARPVATEADLVVSYADSVPFGFAHDTGTGGLNVGTPATYPRMNARTLASGSGTYDGGATPPGTPVYAATSLDLCGETGSSAQTTWTGDETVLDTAPVFDRDRGVLARGTLRFYGTNNYAIDPGLLDGAGDCTIYLRARLADTDGDDQVVFAVYDDTTVGAFVVAATADGFVVVWYSDGVAAGIDLQQGDPDTQWHTICVRRGSGTVSLYIDDVEVDTDTDTGTEIDGGLGAVIGSYADTGQAWNGSQTLHFSGDLSSLLIYDVEHDADTRAEVGAYLDRVEGPIAQGMFEVLLQDRTWQQFAVPATETTYDLSIETSWTVGAGVEFVRETELDTIAKSLQSAGSDAVAAIANALVRFATDEPYTVLLLARPEGVTNCALYGFADATTNDNTSLFLIGGTLYGRVYDQTGTGNLATVFASYPGEWRLYAHVVDRPNSTQAVYSIGPTTATGTGATPGGTIAPAADFFIGKAPGATLFAGRASGWFVTQRAMSQHELELLATKIGVR